MATNILQPPKSIGRQLNFTAGNMNMLCQHLLEPYGISLPQWVVLSSLWRNNDLTVGALSELIGTGLPATSRIIERMVKLGLINKWQDESDGRVTIVSLTPKANELKHLNNFYQTINSALFADFTPEERKLSFELLRRMELNAKKAINH